MMDFLLIIHSAEEGGYWAEIPDVEGCFVQGETIDSLLADAPLAISSHFDALRADDQSIPNPGGIVLATITVPMSSVA